MTEPVFKTVKISGTPYYCRYWKSLWYNKGRNDPLKIRNGHRDNYTKAPLMILPEDSA